MSSNSQDNERPKQNLTKEGRIARIVIDENKASPETWTFVSALDLAAASQATPESVAKAMPKSLAEAIRQPIVEAAPLFGAEATPQSLAKATSEAITEARPQSAAEAIPLSRVQAALELCQDTVVEPATASAVDIAAIIRDELKFGLESHKKLALNLPAGWTDRSKDFGPGKLAIVKDFGEEEVGVVFTTREHPHLESLAFKVWISKESSDDNLIFEAEADGKSIGISKIVLVDEDDADDELFEDNENNEEGKDENEGSTYHALVFSEPNRRQLKMHQAFVAYLDERGVNAELGQFLIDFSKNKEQSLSPVNYTNMLLDMQEFLDQ